VHLKPVSVAAVVGLIVLTFFEYPAWCNEATDVPCDEFVSDVFLFLSLFSLNIKSFRL